MNNTLELTNSRDSAPVPAVKTTITDEKVIAILERLEADRRAATAPDKAKLKTFSDFLRDIEIPEIKDAVLFAQIKAKLDALAGWIESQYGEGLI